MTVPPGTTAEAPRIPCPAHADMWCLAGTMQAAPSPGWVVCGHCQRSAAALEAGARWALSEEPV